MSQSLQYGKAAEHLVCAHLILQGWNAFLADAGLPYDLLVDQGDGRFFRVQVKSTCRLYRRRDRKGTEAYRFPLRKSRTGDRRISLRDCDVLALVALEPMKVAFIPVSFVIKGDGTATTLVEMKTHDIKYERGRAGIDPNTYGRFIEDFASFDPGLDKSVWRSQRAPV